MKLYKKNDYVVMPSYGVLKVKRIEERNAINFYLLNCIDNNMILLIPINKNELRPLNTKKEIQKLQEIVFTQKPKLDNTTWNRRYRECSEKLKSGNIKLVLEVIRDLDYLQVTKDLSFGERKMLEHANNLIDMEYLYAN